MDERIPWVIGLVASALLLVPFYTTTLTPPNPSTFFGYSLGEFEFFGYFSLTHGYAALGFLIGFAALALYDGFEDKHPRVFALILLVGALVAASDYAEFLGPYLPWLSLGSLVSIPVGVWFGVLLERVSAE